MGLTDDLFEPVTCGGQVNCDECKHLIYGQEETYGGKPYTECGIAKCPLVLRNEALEEAAKAADAKGFPPTATDKHCTRYARDIAKAIRSLKTKEGG